MVVNSGGDVDEGSSLMVICIDDSDGFVWI